MARKTHAMSFVAGAAILGTGLTAEAALIQFREGAGTFNDNPVTTTTFDDVGIGIGGATKFDTSSVQTVSVNSSQVRFGLIAIKDMFALLPKTSGDEVINITSATLYLTRINGSDAYTIGVARITTDWLLGDAGTNEADVDGDKRSISGDLSWANGSFSTDDYTAVGSTTSSWTANPTFDITAIITAMYASETNYGMVLYPVSGGSASQQYLSSERSSVGSRPVIAIEYNYAPIPEPASLGLLGLGGLILCHRRRRA